MSLCLAIQFLIEKIRFPATKIKPAAGDEKRLHKSALCRGRGTAQGDKGDTDVKTERSVLVAFFARSV
jgi:hypothetical protein